VPGGVTRRSGPKRLKFEFLANTFHFLSEWRGSAAARRAARLTGRAARPGSPGSRCQLPPHHVTTIAHTLREAHASHRAHAGRPSSRSVAEDGDRLDRRVERSHDVAAHLEAIEPARSKCVTGEDQSSVTSCCDAAEFGCRHNAPCLSWEPAAPIDNARPWAIARCFDQCTVDHLRSTHTRALANAPRARGRHAKRTG